MRNKTIFALSTAPGKASIAIIRISGDTAFAALKRLTNSIPQERKAVVRNLTYKNELIDEAVVLCFPAANSYTGEDLVELHVHGSNAVIRNMSEILSTELNLRIAKPGEFTRRALEQGRMSLSQAEGLLDLINSETKEQQKQSLNALKGKLKNKTQEWRELVLRALTLTEIMIDFSDEDVPSNTVGEISTITKQLLSVFKMELKNFNASEIVRDGFDITILGKPNIGKSSLINYLAGKERAIVSSEAGTTRDLIEVGIDLKGYRVNFFDTAGIHKTENIIEKIGINRALEKAKSSDLRIFLLGKGDRINQFKILVKSDDLIFCAKSDINNCSEHPGVSGKTGDGVDEMLNLIFNKIKNKTKNSSILINERHKNAITKAVLSLSEALQELNKVDVQIEIVAECFRLVVVQLDMLVGRINVEDVLGSIFSSFCIGK